MGLLDKKGASMTVSHLASAYLPMDRRLALLDGAELPEWSPGAVLFADLKGFTNLGEKLSHRLGPEQGAEELNRQVSACFADLIAAMHRYRGAIVSFAGDGLLGVFSGLPDPLACATAAAYAVQSAMGQHPALSLRIGLGAGPLHRRVLGDPAYGLYDVVGGPALETALAAMEQALPGRIAGAIALERATPCPWPDRCEDQLPDEILRAWIPGEIYRRLTEGAAGFVAELRQVVALFMRLDCPDQDLPAHIARVQRVLLPYEAWLNQVEVLDKGTVLVVLFGAPVAHGDDPLRAMKAALAIRAAGRPEAACAMRLGLSLGPLYTGLVGNTRRLAYTAYGDEMNVAARLMQAAGPDEVLVNARLRRAAERRYRFADLPDIAVKGRAEPVSIARLEGPKGIPTAAERNPLVGRGEELAQLETLRKRVCAGQGHTVLLRGEAGIGKSRLTAALFAAWQQHGGQTVLGQAQAAAQQHPYFAWQELLRHLWRLYGDADDWARLEARVAALSPDLLARLPLLGDVLGLPFAETPLTRSLDPQLRQTGTQALIVELLRAEEGPLLLALEDTHWLDGPSWALTLAVARGLADRPTLLLLTSRPVEPPPPAWSALQGLPRYRELALEAFSPDEAIEFARMRLKVGRLPSELAAFLQARSQGNPFFIEELVHMVVEEGYVEGRGEGLVVCQPLESAGLPDNIQGIVLARMDRLDEPTRLTTKVASVIGRTFPYPVLRATHPVLAGADDLLQQQLSNLEVLDIVLTDTPVPEPVYAFQHAIIHEVAYHTLLFAQRRELHGRIAHYYEERYAGQLEPHYALLAYHYGRSGDEERHIHYCQQAGQEAARRYANAEAVAFYSEALQVLAGQEERQGPTAEILERRVELLRRREEMLRRLGRRDEQGADIETLLALAQALGRRDLYLDATQRWASCLLLLGEYDRSREVLHETLASLQEGDAPRWRGTLLWTLGRVVDMCGYSQEAVEYLEQAVVVFAEAGAEDRLPGLLNALGLARCWMSDYEQALACFGQALEISQRIGDFRAEIQSRGNIGFVLWDCGQYQEALTRYQQVLWMTRQAGDINYLGAVLNNLGDLSRYMGRYAEAIEYLQQALRVAREMQSPSLESECLNNLGQTLMEEGDFAAAAEHLERALAVRESLGEVGAMVLDRSFLARALLGLGENSRALVLSREALAAMQAAEIAVNWEHQVHYNHYLICRAQGLDDEAGQALERAYQVMRTLAEGMAPEPRRAFLEGVRVNREIAEAWRGAGNECTNEPAEVRGERGPGLCPGP
jgi:class 3 adenylate cyclase/tetratricopeptide (TPR) repeat protein